MSALLEVVGLSKRFGGLVAAKDISFAIQSGEILGESFVQSARNAVAFLILDLN